MRSENNTQTESEDSNLSIGMLSLLSLLQHAKRILKIFTFAAAKCPKCKYSNSECLLGDSVNYCNPTNHFQTILKEVLLYMSANILLRQEHCNLNPRF